MSERGASGPRDKGELDRVYAERFWARSPEGMRAAYQASIESAARTGTLSIFVNMEGLDEKDKEKMSAFRLLARELGYEVGQFRVDRNRATASAPIQKKSR